MAINYNPKIATDGLILAVDAGNTKSYPGSGTTWTNLSSGINNGTLTNSPTFSSDNKGKFTFDGTNTFVDFTDSGLLPTAGLTIHTWFKTSVADKWLVDKSVGSVSSGYCLIGSSGGNMFFFVNNISVSTPTTIANGNWLNIIATWTPSVSMIIYQNGVQVASQTTSVPASITDPSYNLQFCRRRRSPSTPIDFWSGDVAQVFFYNRAISASEAAQNFNATRGRYSV